jgi:phosphoglycerate dehydrogenase-like enzyme
VCIFVNDKADEACINNLAKLGVKVLLLRSAGFNHVDLAAASTAGISVRRVPAYSPYAVAEMAVGLLLALVRKIPRAYDRVRNHNFNISGLEGFDIHGKTIGLLDSLHHPAICFWRQLPLHMFLRTHAHAHQHHAQAHAHACIMHASRQARINGASTHTHTRPKMKSTQNPDVHKIIPIFYNFRVLLYFSQIWTGIVGTGKIGQIAAKILSGFSPGRLIGYDVFERCLCVLLWHAIHQ